MTRADRKVRDFAQAAVSCGSFEIICMKDQISHRSTPSYRLMISVTIFRVNAEEVGNVVPNRGNEELEVG